MLLEYAHFFRSTLEHLADIKLRANLGDVFTEELCERLKEILETVLIMGRSVSLDATNHLADDLMKEIKPNMNVHALDARIESLQSIFRKELRERQFFYVPKELAGFYDNKSLCGAVVAKRFPNAIPDIIEAGNCYALRRPTACVFHLMRVVPYGMAALAKLLRVKYSTPIICLDWNSIIQPIEKAIRGIQQLPKTPKKMRDVKDYSEIAQHLNFCKDAWRNHVSHASEPYDMNQARSVLDHVTLIMELVGKRLKKPFTGPR
jgi:hypothetical protein